MTLGRVSGVHGVHGWVRVRSWTEEPARILEYSPWRVRVGADWVVRTVAEGRVHGKGLIARLECSRTREDAERLRGAEIAVPRSQLPEPAPGEYYWTDLVGLEVVTAAGQVLGRVDHLLDTGANDVLVVRGDGERLVPFLAGTVIREVDLRGGRIEVDWDPEF